jgi:hypothetical protein
LIAACVAIALTVVEALCVAGMDNLLVPLGAWGMMRWLEGISGGALAVATSGIVFGVVGIVCVYALMATPGLEGVPVLNRNTDE